MEEKVELNKNDHTSDVLERLNRFRNSNKFCDFIIRAGGKEMPVHKCVVSASSEYFNAMLSHDTKENIEGFVEIKQVDPDCVVKCVEFMYTGEASVSEENQSNLLHVAHMLQLKRLYNGIAVFLERKLDSATFFSTREIANLYDCNELVNVCNKFALNNFRVIAQLDGFKNLEVEYVNFLLSSDGLKDSSGIKCKALMTWINYDSDRAASLFGLMKHIDFCEVPMSYRRYLIENELTVSKSVECLSHVVKSILDSVNVKASDMSLEKTPGIVVLDSKSKMLKCLDLQEKTWSDKQAMHQDMVNKPCSVVVVGEHIYALVSGKKTYRLHIDEANGTWEQMTDRNGNWAMAVVLNEMIYCANHGEFSDRIEVFDPQQNQWSFTRSKSIVSAYFTITVVQDNVYLIGGQQEDYSSEDGDYWDCTALKTVERYHPTTSIWLKAPSLRQARWNASATTLDDSIYLFGGKNDNGYVPSLEILHKNANSWQLVNLSGFKYQNYSSHTIGGKIYLVGTNSSTYQAIEEYDPNTNELQTVDSLSNMTVWYSSSVAVLMWS